MDAEGRIIATLEDYEVVRGLVSDLIAEGVEATVPPDIRETVMVVDGLASDGVTRTRKSLASGMSVQTLANELRLDKSNASRRANKAIEQGYLRNLEDKKGAPAQLVRGEPLPEDQRILPTVEELADAIAKKSR